MTPTTTTTIHGDRLQLGGLSLTFQRTLRIPDDGKTYPLPPGLGAFPLRKVDDYADRVPDDWREHGGVFLPMYQREAMWLSFSAAEPRALKVAVGKVSAITGEPWREGLGRDPQDYVVTPGQPWLDGICVGKGKIRQFVAMPLGLGYTVEAQVSGEERFGGIQLEVFAPQRDKLPRYRASGSIAMSGAVLGCCPPPAGCAPAPRSRRATGSMGLAAGGRMKQKIYPDPFGADVWREEREARCFVHIVNSELWREITGEEPPKTPVTAKTYAKHGLPWYDLYDEHRPTLDATDTLAGVKSVKQLDGEKSTWPLQDDQSVPTPFVKKLWNAVVRDGRW